jgi:PAS domain S-box-containing protein
MVDDVPDQVLRLMGRLERFTGRMPMNRVVTIIVTLGLFITSLMMGAVWWAEQHRQQAAFRAAAQALQVRVQDRLDHRVLMLHQMAFMSGLDHGSSAAPDPSWLPSDVQRLSLRTEPASPWERDLLPCLQRVQPGEQTRFCPETVSTSGLMGTLATPIVGADDEWLISRVRHQTVWPLRAAPGAWVLQGDFKPLALWRPQGRLVRGEHITELQVTLLGQPQPLSIAGRYDPQTLAEIWSPWTGVAVAGLAGILFTLGGLHVYVMLISTRRRARDMARDMNAALQRTQSRNQVVMDAAPDAIVMADEQGVVQWCNQASMSIFGRPAEALIGRPVAEVLPVLGEMALAHWFEQHGFSNRVIAYETSGLRNEGTAFPVAVSASRAVLDQETIVTFIVRDTTDAKWAEQELLLRDRAIASSADGVVIASMTLPNQPIIYANQAFERITGYESHEILGTNCRFLQGAEQDQPAVQTIRNAIAQGQSCHVVLRNFRKDGGLFYNELALSPVANADGKVTHYVGVQTDITERMAAEQVLHLRTERLNAVFELSPDGFVVLDKRGEVSIVNPSFERMTGLLAADLVGLSEGAFEELMSLRSDPADVSLGQGAGVFDKSTDADSQDSGAVKRSILQMHTPVARTLVRSVRQGGQENETVMYFRDITHELEVDRMKSEFLAMAAHELRTPMVSIFGFTELLLKRNFTDERRADMLGTIHRQASVLINLVNELLDLARIESRRGKDFKRAELELQPLVQAVIDGLLMRDDPRKVRCELPAEPIVVNADVQKLSLALTNVLSNAYKYSPQGGDIELDMVWRRRDDHDEVGVRITDHGIGMTSEQQGRLFERFFRADTSGNIPGTGLGMTIVKEIIELHGGQVSVLSAFGVGTTVTLWLPVCGLGDPSVKTTQVVEVLTD